jgi:hypothetical protein
MYADGKCIIKPTVTFRYKGTVERFQIYIKTGVKMTHPGMGGIRDEKKLQKTILSSLTFAQWSTKINE